MPDDIKQDAYVSEATEKFRSLGVEPFLVQSATIDPFRIQDEFVELPGQVAYWSRKHADSVENFQYAEMEEGRTKSMLRIRHRQTLLDANLKPTESQVDAKVDLDDDMSSATRERIAAEAQVARLKGVMEALKTKRDMLIQLGAHTRMEMQGDPLLRRQHATNSSFRNRDEA